MIIKGSLTNEELSTHLNKLGYRTENNAGTHPILIATSLIASPATYLALLVFILTFTSLTLIYRIKNMRFSGIRLISGKSLLSIMYRDIQSDGLDILFSSLLCILIGISGLAIFGTLRWSLVSILLSGIFLYALILVLISIFLSFIYLISLKKVDLMEVIKGKVPLYRILFIILLGQFFSFLMIGWGTNHVMNFLPHLKVQESAISEWNNHNKRFNLQFGLGLANNNEIFEKVLIDWEAFVKEAITEQDGLLVEHNLTNFVLSNTDRDSTKLEEYVPLGNTLYVTPNYFDEQKIELDSHIKEKLNNLKQGEFGLILPEKLKKDTDTYYNMYQNYVSNFAKDNLDLGGNALFEVKGIISYLPDNQQRFIYNTTSITKTQFLLDPIIIVITPNSFSNTLGSRIFWWNSNSYLFLNSFETSVHLLKKHSLYSYISYASNSSQTFYELLNTIRGELIALIIGTILGILTSILLFNSMTLLYFEQFRREIFIKRISGMHFREIHQTFILTQLIVFLFSFSLVVLITKNIGVSLTTLILFGVNSFIILYYQYRSENKTAISVLKGK